MARHLTTWGWRAFFALVPHVLVTPSSYDEGVPPHRPVAERFWEKVNKDGPTPIGRPDLGACWLWTASLKRGYGQFGVKGGQPPSAAYRVAYELVIGPIPKNLQLDHLCRVPACVNPSHLEPVTQRENLRRGDTFVRDNLAKTHCPSGHPYDETNTYFTKRGHRMCRTCHRDRSREAYRRSVGKGAATHILSAFLGSA